MFALNRATRVFVKTGAADMRLSFNGLYAQVVSILRQDPLSGHLFCFCNRARTRVKILTFDGSGLWIFAKRLERATFAWPQEGETEINPDPFASSADRLRAREPAQLVSRLIAHAISKKSARILSTC